MIPDEAKKEALEYIHADHHLKDELLIYATVIADKHNCDAKEMQTWVLDQDVMIKKSKKKSKKEQTIHQNGLPQIVVSNRQLSEMTDDCLNALYQDMDINPEIFQSNGILVEKLIDEKGKSKISPLTSATLRSRLSRKANFFSVTKASNGDTTIHEVVVKKDIIEDCLSQKEYKFPALEGLSLIPILHDNAEIVTRPGYDTVSRMIYCPPIDLNLPDIPDNPNSEDIERAKEWVREPYAQFPFKDEASRENTIGYLISLVARSIVRGRYPMYMVDKPQMGTGASLVMNVCSIIATGEEAAFMVLPTNKEADAELHKTITTKLVSGLFNIVIDNIEGVLKSPILSGLITAPKWNSRLLGFNKEVIIDNKTMLAGTGNNIILGGDLPRRCYFTYLISKSALAWMDNIKYTHDPLVDWCKENRPQILAAVIILIKAWLKAGKPKPKNIPRLGSFEDFRDTIGGIMEYVGFTHFLENLVDSYNKNDVDRPQWAAFVAEWYKAIGTKAITVKELIELITTNDDLRDSLPDELKFDEKKEKPERSFGKALSKKQDNLFSGDYRLIKAGEFRRAAKWAIISKENPEKGAFQCEFGQETHTNLASNVSICESTSIPPRTKAENEKTGSGIQSTHTNSQLASKQCEFDKTNSHYNLPQDLLDLWDSKGKPVIYLAPGESTQDLAKTLTFTLKDEWIGALNNWYRENKDGEVD